MGKILLSRRIILNELAPSALEKDLRRSLQVQTIPLPPLANGKIRIQIHFASLNFADVLVVQGKYQEKPKLPSTLGSECCGTILQIHESLLMETKAKAKAKAKANHLRIGQPVLVVCTTSVGAGAYADYFDAYPWQIFPIPLPPNKNMTTTSNIMKHEIAAGFAVAAGTAHIALVDRANVQNGDLVVVTGASGGTGMYACLIAKALDCRVVATARGEEKVNFVKSLLGPEDVVINLRDTSHNTNTNTTHQGTSNEKEETKTMLTPEQQLIQAVYKINKRGAQVIYDTVGGSLFKTLLRCAKWKCRLCVVGFAAGSIPKIPSNILLVKNSSVVGVYWGNYFLKEPKTVIQSLYALFDLVQKGKLKLDSIPIHKFQWDLSDLPAALAALAKGKTYGKVIVKCHGDEVSPMVPVGSKL